MATLQIYYDATVDWETAAQGNQWWAQTFTTVGAFTITAVQLNLQRYGSPGTVTIAITAVDGSGNPVTPDLTTGTTDGDTLPTATYEWREITLTPYLLSGSTQYAVIYKALSGNASNDAEASGLSPGAYTGGMAIRTTDGGLNWTQFSGDDMVFKTYGTSAFIPRIFYF